MRTLKAALLILVMLVAFALPIAPAQSQPAPVASSDAQFNRDVKEFIDSELKLFPERATELGDHRFDTRVDDESRQGIAAVISHATHWKKEFSDVSPAGLTPAEATDREWLLAQIDGELLWNQQVKSYERDPGMYMPTSGVYSLIQRNFAPAAVRMRAVTAREKAALANLAAAKSNLKPERVPPIAIDIELMQLPATIAFFRKDLVEAFASVPEGKDKESFIKATSALTATIEGYGKWLKDDLRPHARGDYAIGADAFSKMLADDDMVTTPLDKLEQIGQDEMHRLQKQFVATAKLIDANRTPSEVAAAMATQHPEPSQVIPSVNAGLAAIREYVVSHHIARIPSMVPPIVAETPPFMRATTFASMDSPGPFEKTSEAYFYVTLPDPSWPKEKQEQLLAFYSPPTISDTSVHEVYPGHYVQFLNNRLNPDLVRKIYASGADVEGWALYCEQMMLDEGLHRGDPHFRLAQLQMALMRACRYLVGIRMHTHGMTVAQATAFFEQSAYQTHHNAEVEALRGTGDPGYLRYQLGKLMILKLREDLQRQEGAAFDLGKFHDAFLAEGALPVPLIRRAMLGENAGPAL
ncbi:MAG TPA: DUF885 domain-containing protein [Candidatus Binataceae bacterium]|nr:DUF885 domain-containing protein [Candidatus Binataceae bacterium]